ncbi:hypothetical protein ACFVS2_26135 [Brevibacillus sp. NPDC058079]|uniref:hypothetical protein n=1 Tax=Brevibacillus sp. NPDC058079 TaxID=3346330 RepID=UPI0036DFD586
MQSGEQFFVTWVESDKAEIIEDMLDECDVPIEMLPTPENIRNQVAYVMVCKDAFRIVTDRDAAIALGTLSFPEETRCFNEVGTLVWEK